MMQRNLAQRHAFFSLWGTLCLGAALGNVLFAFELERASAADPLGEVPSFLSINFLFAITVSLLASNLSGSWGRRSLVLFVTMFVVEAVLSACEAYVFRSAVGMPTDFLLHFTGAVAVKSAIAGMVAALLFKQRDPAPDPFNWKAWRICAVVMLYVFVYFTAGFLVAWQSTAVQAYYGDGSDIDLLRLFYVQVARGLVWAAVATLLVRSLTGQRWQKALLCGSAFAIFMAAPLLAPNAYMPWDVRQVHMLEVGLSNFIFGVLAVFILERRRPSAGIPEQVLATGDHQQDVAVQS
jgi:hypothetical protein